MVPAKKYIDNDMKVRHTDDDPILFDQYVAEALHEILDTQHKITEYTKEKNAKKLVPIFKILTISPMIQVLLDNLRCVTRFMSVEDQT